MPPAPVDVAHRNAVVTITDTSTVKEASALLVRHGLGQAPVVTEAGVLVGLLSRAGLVRPDRLPGPESHALVWRALLAQAVLEVM